MKRFVGYVIDKAVKALPRKKKVSPTIKSVKPTKDVKGSVERTKKDATAFRTQPPRARLSFRM